MFYPHLGVFLAAIGFLALFLIPRTVRDLGYRLFASHRGRIWIAVKTVTRMGDTAMHPYRDSILGLGDDDPRLPESWGFGNGNGNEQGNDDHDDDNHRPL